MKVIFSHGKESGPWGSKIKAMADLAESKGCEVDSIDYTDLVDEPDARAERLIAVLQQETGPVILVGSSMGGVCSHGGIGAMCRTGAVPAGAGFANAWVREGVLCFQSGAD